MGRPPEAHLKMTRQTGSQMKTEAMATALESSLAPFWHSHPRLHLSHGDGRLWRTPLGVLTKAWLPNLTHLASRTRHGFATG